MYQRIMVAVDGSASSSRALDEAVRMAKLSGGKVFAVYVVDKTLLFTYAGYYDPAALLEGLRRDGKDALRAADASFSKAGVTAQSELIETDDIKDDIANCLQRQAKRIEADLVVLGTHGRRGIRRAVLGSVSERFLRASAVPTLLVRCEADEDTAAARV